MKYHYIFLVIFLLHARSSAMDVVENKKMTQDLFEQGQTFRFDERKEVSVAQERKDAAFYIRCIDILKENTEKIIGMHKAGYQRLTDKELSWFDHYILASSINRYKVEENRGAVYRKLCSMRLAGPDDIDYTLGFWQKLLKKKKISKEMYDQQREQIEKLNLRFQALEEKGIIVKCLRNRSGLDGFKASL